MNDLGLILDIITSWADEIGSFALSFVAVGALSMAMLEAFKGMFKIRARIMNAHLKNG